jgi:hypothetical protein
VVLIVRRHWAELMISETTLRNRARITAWFIS